MSGDDGLARWFTATARALDAWDPKAKPVPVAGNTITPYIDVAAYYAAVGAAVRATRTQMSDFVYFAGWELDLDTFVDPPGANPRQTLRQLLTDRARNGVQVRVILDSTANRSNNEQTAKDVAAMPGGGGIVDPLHQLTGSQHQKMVISRNANGVQAFCGGMDIANHRLGRDGYTGPPITKEMVEKEFPLLEKQHAPWHDVQVRIEGAAAADLWMAYVQRWSEAANAGSLVPDIEGPLVIRGAYIHGEEGIFAPASNDAARDAGPLVAQVVRTYPNITRAHLGIGAGFSGSYQEGYQFARNGERGNYDAIVHAIDTATSTIYLEDQYLVDSAAAGALAPVTVALRRALNRPTFKSLLIAIAGTGTVQAELHQAASRRREFMLQLGPEAATKARVYAYTGDLNSPYWFHAKTWVFDDEVAIVTSANCNRRSYTCDAEIGAVIAGTRVGASEPFAQELRVQLWLKHLNAVPIDGKTASLGLTPAAVSDFAAAVPLWEKAPLLKRVDHDLADDRTPDIPLSERMKAFIARYPTVSEVRLLKGLLDDRNFAWALIDPDAS